MSDHALAVLGLALALIFGILGIAVSYYFYFKGREKADPRYILTCGPLLGDSSNLAQQVSLLVNGEEFDNLNRCLLVFWNRGSRTLRGSDIVRNDQTRIVFPAGLRALAAHVIESTRQSIDLTAAIDEGGRNVVIEFDFLDRGDGGVIQIIYQGDPTMRPEVTGSIRGVPEGIRMPALGGNLSFSDGLDEDESGTWKGPFALVAILIVFTYFSSTFFGLGYPLTVVFMTLLGEISVILVVGILFSTFIRQSIGNFMPKITKGMDR
jgi:hypothetical protein